MPRFLKNVLMAAAGVIAAIYLINPTAGILELIPDNLPMVGNLDEAAATALILAVLRYFGWDITQVFQRRKIKDVHPPSENE